MFKFLISLFWDVLIISSLFIVPCYNGDFINTCVLIVYVGYILCFNIYLFMNRKDLYGQRIAGIANSKDSGVDNLCLLSIALCRISIITIGGYFAVVQEHLLIPEPARVLGLIGLLLSLSVCIEALQDNPFLFSKSCDTNKTHFTVNRGLYSNVRHPFYSGAIFSMLFTVLAIGSWIGIPFVLQAAMMYATKTVIEEDFLLTKLTDYKAYMHQVKNKFINLWK